VLAQKAWQEACLQQFMVADLRMNRPAYLLLQLRNGAMATSKRRAVTSAGSLHAHIDHDTRRCPLFKNVKFDQIERKFQAGIAELNPR
jgi:hypothetical protein